MREKVDPGNWELHLSGSTPVKRLIDDSGTTNPEVNVSGRVFNIVSGSITNGFKNGIRNNFGAGLFYPDLGIIILNPDFG